VEPQGYLFSVLGSEKDEDLQAALAQFAEIANDLEKSK
jgi:hypothetical protein